METDAPEWAKIYDRDSRDVLVMQSELAQAIVGHGSGCGTRSLGFVELVDLRG